MHLIEKAMPSLIVARNFLNALSNVLMLGIRLYIAKVFFLSGLTKIQDWETTLTLFQEEYHVPLVSPEIAAIMGTLGELVLPAFLLFGLATRFAALGLTFVNVMAVVSYWHFLMTAEPALAQHIYWGVLILAVLLYGPGKLSLDAIVWKNLKPD